jgi:hypothetical protein
VVSAQLLILDTDLGPVMAIAELTITPTGQTTVEARYAMRVWRIGATLACFPRG